MPLMDNNTFRVSEYAPANETAFDIWYEVCNLDGAILVAVAYGKRLMRVKCLSRTDIVWIFYNIRCSCHAVFLVRCSTMGAAEARAQADMDIYDLHMYPFQLEHNRLCPERQIQRNDFHH